MAGRLKNLVSRLSGRQITESAATVPATSRQHLAHQIEETLQDRTLVERLDDTIETTKEKLEKMEKSEQFLDTRIRKYRKMLAEQQIRINRDDNDMDEATRQKQIEQQERYQLQICDVIDIHKNILAEVETLRRKLKDLETKRDKLLTNREECEEFLVASAELDLQGADDDNTGSGEDAEDMEMGVLNRVEPSEREIM